MSLAAELLNMTNIPGQPDVSGGFMIASDVDIDSLISMAKRDALDRIESGITLPDLSQIKQIISTLKDTPDSKPKTNSIRKTPYKKTRNKEAKRESELERINNSLRSLWKIGEPELHEAPSWLFPLIRNGIKQKILPKCSWPDFHKSEALRYLESTFSYCCHYPWFDHVGRLKINNEEFLVSEPYFFHDEHWEDVQIFCKILGLTYWSSNFSWWNPAGGTIRICIKPLPPTE